MSSVEPEPPAAGLDAAFTDGLKAKCIAEREVVRPGVKIPDLRAVIFDLSLTELWVLQLGKPGPLPKIAKSKAKALLAGKELQDPGMCGVMCCHVCPWMCGCSPYMAIKGSVEFEHNGQKLVLVVAGAQPGAQGGGGTDLLIAKAMLESAGITVPAGAPDATSMTR